MLDSPAQPEDDQPRKNVLKERRSIALQLSLSSLALQWPQAVELMVRVGMFLGKTLNELQGARSSIHIHTQTNTHLSTSLWRCQRKSGESFLLSPLQFCPSCPFSFSLQFKAPALVSAISRYHWWFFQFLNPSFSDTSPQLISQESWSGGDETKRTGESRRCSLCSQSTEK